jgi:hypothetical protein
MERESAETKRELPVSHLRHTSDKTCNVKASPNHPVELTAHSAGFLGCPLLFLLWTAAHRERSATIFTSWRTR